MGVLGFLGESSGLAFCRTRSRRGGRARDTERNLQGHGINPGDAAVALGDCLTTRKLP